MICLNVLNSFLAKIEIFFKVCTSSNFEEKFKNQETGNIKLVLYKGLDIEPTCLFIIIHAIKYSFKTNSKKYLSTIIILTSFNLHIVLYTVQKCSWKYTLYFWRRTFSCFQMSVFHNAWKKEHIYIFILP
jgi:hypothetical protein